MTVAVEINAAEIEALVRNNKRIAIRLGAKRGIDADEAQALYASAVVEAASRFDPTRGATLKTFAGALYEAALHEAAAQARYGFELDAKDEGDDSGAVERHVAAILGFEEDEEEEIAGWRLMEEQMIEEKIGLLPAKLRAFAHLISNGDSVEEASTKLGMTDRNGRYMQTQILELLLTLKTDAGQSCLQLPAFQIPAGRQSKPEPKAKKSRIPGIDDLPGIQQLGLF